MYNKRRSKSHLIGAASIIAKYERDIYMIDLHKVYPQYDFETNKGYPTKTYRKYKKIWYNI